MSGDRTRFPDIGCPETSSVTISAPADRAEKASGPIAVPQRPLPARARTWVLWLTIAALLAWK